METYNQIYQQNILFTGQHMFEAKFFFCWKNSLISESKDNISKKLSWDLRLEHHLVISDTQKFTLQFRMNQKETCSLEIWFTHVPVLKWYWLKSILFKLFVSAVAWFYFGNVMLNYALWLINELIWGGRLSAIKLQCFHLNTRPYTCSCVHKHNTLPQLLPTPNLSFPSPE